MTEEERKAYQGLSESEVEASRRAHGKNTLRRAGKKSFWRVFFSNLGDPVIKVLLVALGLHLLLLFYNRDWLETVGIAVSVFLATFISTMSEYGSETAFQRLNDACGTDRCRVRRAGATVEIDVADVVVGDIVLLGAGEKIPADGVLLGGHLTVDQSPLTGESREAEKHPYRRGEKIEPHASGAVFSGCTILSGEGEMRVSAVGDATFLGGISGELQTQTRESPLKLRLSKLAKQISVAGYVAAVICALTFLFHRLVLDAGFLPAEMLARLRDLPYMANVLLHALTLALTVVVVAVPEGLPMMIAVVLSANIRRMVKDHVLVRKPAGPEAAGSMNILFTDKTGTLTAGKLSLSSILTANGDHRDVGMLRRKAPQLCDLLCLSAHANSGAVRGEREGKAAALGGNATDRALLSAFLAFPAPKIAISEKLPFDSSRKFAAVRLANGQVLVTGAPERLAPYLRTAWQEDGSKVSFIAAPFLARVRTHMSRGERVVLLCEGDRIPQNGHDFNLCLLAAVAFADPLRPEAKEAVRNLRDAGVQVVMMTGDGKETAAHIATACGILGRKGVVLEGEELAKMSDEELSALLPRLAVISRALPGDKSRLIRLSEAAGLVVGMTGDGINDAPALKMADVGFAMGSGTQVAKEAGDVVILDDNLSSVCKAVLYGRTIFKSIRKFITLQLIMNFCAVGISIIGPFIGFDAPVTVVQMLWINMIMDTLGGLAFAGEAPMPYYMKEAPKKREEPILTRALAGRIAVLSAFTVGLSVFFLTSPWVRSFYRASEDRLPLLTAFFAFFIFAGVLNCFNARTDRVRMLAGIGKNAAFLLIMALVAVAQILFVYLGGSVLRTVPLLPGELFFTLGLAALTLPFGFIHLVARRLWGKGSLY
ncbi:MAG: calcium-translocating P-type ATPase, PMCA-type [Ruminococcaceae bacterium]|nr:calcium-translocating P-type ATPase, PMCA-type [Oscillospiraceae bacterium]